MPQGSEAVGPQPSGSTVPSRWSRPSFPTRVRAPAAQGPRRGRRGGDGGGDGDGGDIGATLVDSDSDNRVMTGKKKSPFPTGDKGTSTVWGSQEGGRGWVNADASTRTGAGRGCVITEISTSVTDLFSSRMDAGVGATGRHRWELELVRGADLARVFQGPIWRWRRVMVRSGTGFGWSHRCKVRGLRFGRWSYTSQ